jgi:hypothetical protein
MNMRTLAALVCLGAAPLGAAEKLSPSFRAAFEQTFRSSRSYAVVVQEGVPTTSVYGKEGKSQNAHYSIDVVDGKWKTSQGLLDFDQTAADFLNKGEVMELNAVSYKENRVDLRMVSVEAHKVTRGGLLKSTKREPVATNFKFFFPFSAQDEKDVPTAIEYIGQYLRAFPSEQQARDFSARLATGEGGRQTASTSRPSSSSTGAPAGGTTKKEVKVGMTALEVIEVLGKPEREVSFENKTRWTYPDLTVIFENGRVKEVRF